MEPAASTKTEIRPGADIKRMDKTYPGGKSGSGVYQNIINLMPPHRTYIELCIGGGGIWKNKKPAHINIGVDIDPDVIKYWQGSHPLKRRVGDEGQYFIFKNEDIIEFLTEYPFCADELVYIDPPYLKESRKNGKDLYRYEMDKATHIEMLFLIKELPCMVMISGYESLVYSNFFCLNNWNSHSFQASTRRGMATEWVWFNYPFPQELHDYRYLGKNFKEREHIKNKQQRWARRLERLPVLERNAMIAALNLRN